jgi:hypothetical protein
MRASRSEERVNATSFDMRKAPVALGYFVGDNEGLASSGAIFHPFWSESRTTGTDTFGTIASAPFSASSIFPDPAEGADVRAADFPTQRGKPTPH